MVHWKAMKRVEKERREDDRISRGMADDMERNKTEEQQPEGNVEEKTEEAEEVKRDEVGQDIQNTQESKGQSSNSRLGVRTARWTGIQRRGLKVHE